MMHFIDSFLNRITMYRLVLYELIALLVGAGVLGAFHLVPYNPFYLAYSVGIIFAGTWITNRVFAYAFSAPSNAESVYITALILALIITPASAFFDAHFLMLAGWASAWSMASKYLFAIKRKHIFNPAAFGVAATALFLNLNASWWVGTLWMLPLVAIGGFLVVRKIRRFDLVIGFGISLVVSILALHLSDGSGALHIIQEALLYAPAVFLGTVMLTEPMTTPPTRFLRVWYGALVAFLFAPGVHIGSFYFSPEIALLIGNIFVYLVSPKVKLILTLKECIQLTPDTYEFVFGTDQKLRFDAGQYLEWTLAHERPDSRGIRRYFTIASAPTDPDFRIGVKFYQPMSTFKKKLLSMKKGETLVASQLAGDFTLPKDPKKKLVFIAGGIGVTPFRSMIAYLLDTKQRRDIVMLYANKTVEDVAYIELLTIAERDAGVETLPILTNQTKEEAQASGFPNAVTAELIRSTIPDYREREFYISGPYGMITAFSAMLNELGVPRKNIKKDFFPGFV